METTERRKGGAKRQRRLRVMLALLTFSACLLVFEGGIRLDDWRREQAPKEVPQPLALLQENPEGTGSYRLRPNLDLETRVGNLRVRIRTNAHGMHWRDTPLEANPARPRVAFLGDSFTFGSWVSEVSKSFVGVFETVLGPSAVEALNFGVGGYGLLDEELLLKEQVLRFKPSYVVVVIYTGNDFRDTWLGLRRERIVDGTAQLRDDTAQALVPSDELVADHTVALDCPAPPWRRVANLSAAFRRMAPLFDLEDLCVRFRPNRNFFMPGYWSTVPPPVTALKARDALLAALARLDELTASHQARLSVVVIPTSDQVYALRPTGRAFDIELPQQAIGVFCRDRRIPYLDLLPEFREQAAQSNRRLYVRNDIHLNEFGHRRAGELMAAWFQSRVMR